MKWIPGGVTSADGFVAAGVSAGIKRGGKPDVALVVSNAPATAAGVLTTNRVQAAPVVISGRRLRTGSARAVLINSGCANCLTGAQGLRDALAVSRELEGAMRVNASEVLLASTGMIGKRLPVPKIRRVLPRLVRQLTRQGHRQAARAILTTDTGTKEAAVADHLGGRSCHLGGMAKGSGMIAPHMATMLAVLTTDVAVDRALLAGLLQRAVDASFNHITIDGDMSTNDTVFILANGRSGVRIRRNTAQAKRFGAMLEAVAGRLAHLLVQDGEGATCVARIKVSGAPTEAQAQRCARQVADSLLVKTMLAGADPNVGRIAAAAGASGIRFDPQRLEIRLGGVGPVVRRGAIVPFDAALARAWLRPRPPRYPTIEIDLHAGRATAWMLTCDLTEEYVRINARYST